MARRQWAWPDPPATWKLTPHTTLSRAPGTWPAALVSARDAALKSDATVRPPWLAYAGALRATLFYQHHGVPNDAITAVASDYVAALHRLAMLLGQEHSPQHCLGAMSAVRLAAAAALRWQVAPPLATAQTTGALRVLEAHALQYAAAGDKLTGGTCLTVAAAFETAGNVFMAAYWRARAYWVEATEEGVEPARQQRLLALAAQTAKAAAAAATLDAQCPAVVTTVLLEAAEVAEKSGHALAQDLARQAIRAGTLASGGGGTTVATAAPLVLPVATPLKPWSEALRLQFELQLVAASDLWWQQQQQPLAATDVLVAADAHLGNAEVAHEALLGMSMATLERLCPVPRERQRLQLVAQRATLAERMRWLDYLATLGGGLPGADERVTRATMAATLQTVHAALQSMW
jgi:hypothetical protein